MLGTGSEAIARRGRKINVQPIAPTDRAASNVLGKLQVQLLGTPKFAGLVVTCTFFLSKARQRHDPSTLH